MEQNERYMYYQEDPSYQRYFDAWETAEKLTQTVFGGWTDMNGDPYDEAVEAWLDFYEDDYVPGIDSKYKIYHETEFGLMRVFPCAQETIKVLNRDLDELKTVNDDGSADSYVEVNGTTYYFHCSPEANQYREMSKKNLAISIAEIMAKKEEEKRNTKTLADIVEWFKEKPLLIGDAAEEYKDAAFDIIQKGIRRAGVNVILPKNAKEIREAILKAGHEYHKRVSEHSILK